MLREIVIWLVEGRNILWVAVPVLVVCVYLKWYIVTHCKSHPYYVGPR
jgi:hypothetical protein